MEMTDDVRTVLNIVRQVLREQYPGGRWVTHAQPLMSAIEAAVKTAEVKKA